MPRGLPRGSSLKFKQIESTGKNNRNTKGIISEIDNKSHPILFNVGLKYPISLEEC